MKISDLLISRKESLKPAIYHNDRFLTYKEWYKYSINISKYIDGNMTVGIMLPNSLEYCTTYFSVLFSDSIVMPIYYKISKGDLGVEIVRFNVNILITNKSGLEKIETNMIKKKYVYENIYIIYLFVEPDIKLQNSGCILLLPTSGTTGLAKRVIHTDYSLIENIKMHVESVGFNESEITLITLPLVFGYANTSQFLSHIYLHAQIIIDSEIFIPQRSINKIIKYQITNWTIVPSMANIITSTINEYIESNIKFLFIGGSRISNELYNDLSSILGEDTVFETYGQTEAGPRITLLTPQGRNQNNFNMYCVGKVIGDIDIKIKNNNKVGEILVKSNSLMVGYYEKNKIISSSIQDGWLSTGDKGYIENENIYLLGRMGINFKVNGISISVEEIESKIEEFPKVQESRIFKEKEELCVSLVVSKDFKEKDFIDFLNKNLTHYKIPKKIYYVNSIKKTYNGKKERHNNENVFRS